MSDKKLSFEEFHEKFQEANTHMCTCFALENPPCSFCEGYIAREEYKGYINDLNIITLENLIQKAGTRINVYSEQIEQLEELKHTEYRKLNRLLKELSEKTSEKIGGNLNDTSRENETANDKR